MTKVAQMTEKQCRQHTKYLYDLHGTWAYLEGAAPPLPIEEIFALFKYSLSSFLPKPHVQFV